MAFIELDGNQRRHLINVKQVFSAWRDARRALRRIGGMHWKTSPADQQYLYTTLGRVEKSIGVRSPETERIYADHQRQAAHLQTRIEKTADALQRSARLSKAMNLGRMPAIAARILRKLDDAELLDGALLVAGTNALFAYEAGTGVLFEGDIIATEDLDLLWDARRRMSLLLADVRETDRHRPRPLTARRRYRWRGHRRRHLTD